MTYLDTNALLPALLHVEGRTAPVNRLLRNSGGRIFVSPLTLYETRKHLWTLDQELHAAALAEWARLKTHLRLGGNDWPAAVEEALRVAARYPQRLAVDSADVLHVGWAKLSGATVFASFDRHSGPRALAQCEGLRVWPEMTAEDFRQSARLKPK